MPACRPREMALPANTSGPAKRASTSVSVVSRSKPGSKKVGSTVSVSEGQMAIAAMIYRPILQELEKLTDKESVKESVRQCLRHPLPLSSASYAAIVECLRANKSMIYPDRLHIFSPFVPDRLLYKIAGAALTTSDEVCGDLLRSSLIAKSQKWLSPIGTVYAALGSSTSTGSSGSVTPSSRSWMVKRVPQTRSSATTSSTLYTCFPVEGTVAADTKAKRKQAKKEKATKPVSVDEMIKTCKYKVAVPKTMAKSKYRLCGSKLADGSTACESHNGEESPSGELWPYICTGIKTEGQNKGTSCPMPCDAGMVLCKACSKKRTVGEKTVMRCVSFRLKMNSNQRKLYAEMVGCARKTVNMIIENEGLDGITNLFDLRKRYINENSTVCTANPYLLNCPKASRDAAVEHLVEEAKTVKKRRVTAEAWYKTRTDNYMQRVKETTEMKEMGGFCYAPRVPLRTKLPELRFREKRGSQSLDIDKHSVIVVDKGFRICPKYFKSDAVLPVIGRVARHDKAFDNLKTHGLQSDMKICRTLSNKFYARVSYSTAVDSKEPPNNLAIGIDPGVRKFLSVYTTGDSQYLFGEKFATNYLSPQYRKIEVWKKLKEASSRAAVRGKGQRSPEVYEQWIRQAYDRITNRVRDFHYQCIKHLWKVKDIFIPKMNVAQMIRSEDSRISAENKRHMQALQFGQFRSRLIAKVEEWGNGRQVHVCREDRTTIACCKCFRMNTVGKKETFVCKFCSNVMDRDLNSASNILLKYLR